LKENLLFVHYFFENIIRHVNGSKNKKFIVTLFLLTLFFRVHVNGCKFFRQNQTKFEKIKIITLI